MPLLGLKARTPPSLPCAISVPNLIADREFVFALGSCSRNVRRLMYQSLIWLAVLRDDARSLRPAANSKCLK